MCRRFYNNYNNGTMALVVSSRYGWKCFMNICTVIVDEAEGFFLLL